MYAFRRIRMTVRLLCSSPFNTLWDVGVHEFGLKLFNKYLED